ncbi:four helix bundle protein [filamentous cyanobacterium CCP5]|nr:four helix bundle protein [filamentous cyanobacterium CCP5]
MVKPVADLPVIQKTYDLVKWYVPILNRLPRNHRFTLGERVINGLYDLLEGLILARYSRDKLAILESLNTQLDLLRHQTRLLLDFELMETKRYEYVGKLINEIGTELGGWIRHQRKRATP